jgi:phosphohistidine phosphatase SixA
LRLVEGLEPGGSWRTLEPLLAKAPADVTIVWVGHEPDLGAYAARFLGAPYPMPLKKAGACALVFEGAVRAADADLESWLPPRVLRDLARKGKA